MVGISNSSVIASRNFYLEKDLFYLNDGKMKGFIMCVCLAHKECRMFFLKQTVMEESSFAENGSATNCPANPKLGCKMQREFAPSACWRGHLYTFRMGGPAC